MAAGYKDFTAGAVLTAADLEDYCENQSIMRFASASARDTALSVVKTEGMYAHLIDLNVDTVYTGSTWSTIGPVHGAWTTFTTTWSGTLGNGTKVSYYMRIGRRVEYRIAVTWGSTTSHAAATQTFTLPFAEGTGYAVGSPMGLAGNYDSSAGAPAASGIALLTTGSTISVQVMGVTVWWSNTQPMTWATSDVCTIWGSYECSADA